MSNFHPLEVVDRGSDPQLQVGENFNKYLRVGGPTLSAPHAKPLLPYRLPIDGLQI